MDITYVTFFENCDHVENILKLRKNIVVYSSKIYESELVKLRGDNKNIVLALKEPDVMRFFKQKFILLEEVIENNPFKTKMFAWFDSSVNINSLSLPLTVSNVYVCLKSYGCLKDYRISSSFLLGESDKILRIVELFKKEFLEYIDNNLKIDEDKMLSNIVKANIKLFDFFYGDVNNIDKLNTSEGKRICLKIFEEAYDDKNFILVLHSGMALIDYHIEGFWRHKEYFFVDTLTEEWYNTVYKTYIGAYYSNQFAIALECYRLLINKGSRDMLLNNKKFLIDNFLFMNDKISKEDFVDCYNSIQKL